MAKSEQDRVGEIKAGLHVGKRPAADQKDPSLYVALIPTVAVPPNYHGMVLDNGDDGGSQPWDKSALSVLTRVASSTNGQDSQSEN